MDPAQALAWIQAGQILVGAGAAGVDAIRLWRKDQQPGVSEADLDAMCDAIIVGARAHKKLADDDAAG